MSVLLIIAGLGLAFIALVGGNGGPRWSGLVSRLPKSRHVRFSCSQEKMHARLPTNNAHYTTEKTWYR